MKRVQDAGALVMYTVPSAKIAKKAVDNRVDIIVAQGWEFGGHVRGKVATMALISVVVDAVTPTPVVDAGGIADGRGLASVLMLGAAGAVMGTRFLASKEPASHPIHKEMLIAAKETHTLVSEVFDVGWPNAPGRWLGNNRIERWEHAGRPKSGGRPGEGEVIGQAPDGKPIERYQVLTPVPEKTGEIEAMGLWAAPERWAVR